MIRVVCVASFTQVKGHKYLINAFHIAFQHNSRLHLTLVGDGPERQPLENQIKQLGLEKHIEFAGWLTPQGVQEILRKCDIYAQMSFAVMTGRNKRFFSEEGLPISMVEAAGYGLPLIATDSGGISEICRHGINGYLVPECDSEAMANRLLELTYNSKRRLVFGQKSREIAEKEFDAAKQNNTLEAIYEQVVRESV